jgi:uncharacterized coiled-coil protein SlyX
MDLAGALSTTNKIMTGLKFIYFSTGKPDDFIKQLEQVKDAVEAFIVESKKITEELEKIRIQIGDEVKAAFQEETFRELHAELADFRIEIADGRPQYGSIVAVERSQRLNVLAEKIARRYGAAAFPIYRATLAFFVCRSQRCKNGAHITIEDRSRTRGDCRTMVR